MTSRPHLNPDFPGDSPPSSASKSGNSQRTGTPPPFPNELAASPLSQAEALFQRGVELMKADHCSDAVPEFLKSQKLDASSATLLNLGTCYARLGRKATAFKTYEDLSKFSKENVEAYVAAGTTVFKGFETISRAWANFAQETFDASAQVAKQLLTAKTLREAVDVQTDFAKTTFDKLVSEGTKVSEISVKVTNEAAEPINARFNATIEKFLKPVAA